MKTDGNIRSDADASFSSVLGLKHGGNNDAKNLVVLK